MHKKDGENKEDLFFAVFQKVMQDAEAPMAAAIGSQSGSVSRRLQRLADDLIGSWLGKLELYSLVMEFWSATTASVSRERFKTAFQEGYRAFRLSIAALIEEGVASGEFAPGCKAVEVASGLIGMWDSMLLQAWTDNSFDALGSARACMDIILQGLRARKDKESL